METRSVKRLREAPLFMDEEEPVYQDPHPRSAYISFVGTFHESDRSFFDRNWGVEIDAVARERLYAGCDYYESFNDAVNCVVDRMVSVWTLLESHRKGSLDVNIYDDPLGQPGWVIVDADCRAGGWRTTVRVRRDSYVGDAFAPLGTTIDLE